MEWIDILYPKRCPVCLTALKPGTTLICPECTGKIRYVRGATCYACGKPLSDPSKEYCHNCEERRPPFKKGISWAEYSSKYIRRLLSEVKYHENCQLLDFPCLDFCEKHKEEIASWNAEALIPVPVHEKRRRVRGYNQAEEIANRVSKHLSIPVDPTVLIRTENTKAQKELTAEERMKNLSRAFKCTATEVNYQTVILVDDIYTTGSTASACTEALLRSGVKTVYFLSLAIGRDFRSSVNPLP